MVVVGKVVDDGVDLIWERDVVLVGAVGVGPGAGHDGGAGGGADGGGDVAVLDDGAGFGEAVHPGSLDPVITVGGHGVGALLVGEDEEEVGLRGFVGHGMVDWDVKLGFHCRASSEPLIAVILVMICDVGAGLKPATAL